MRIGIDLGGTKIEGIAIADDGCERLRRRIVAPRGDYATGIFAYNFINRGLKHGLRLVGTLKSEPDLNVLAIFER